jgi:inosine-uridine nucleoside N-ribohydrolase
MTAPDPARRRVVLDMDVGIDDAIAIAYLAARADVELVALGSVHGNCSADDATVNALRVLEACGLPGVPVARGAAEPLDRALHLALFVHGHDGLGEARLPAPAGAPTGEHAADQIVRLAAEQPGELDLLAVGPLTNLGLALRRDPAVLERYRSVVIMGGSGPYPEPGVLREFDANIDHDPAAASLVFSAPRRELVMVGVNVTSGAILDEDAIAAIAAAETPQARLVSAILPFYLDFYRHKWGRLVCSMHDPLAAAILADPGYVTGWLEGPVNVIDDGALARAWLMLREDGDAPVQRVEPAPPTRVAVGVDAARFSADLVRALLSPLPERSPA